MVEERTRASTPLLAADRHAGSPRALRRELVGAWRLIKIEVIGSNGRVTDPFYQADSVGAILYDASGWMSVQIAAPHRQPLVGPVARGQGDVDQRLAAFDTYYAYFGSWSVDDTRGTVTHHVVASMNPSETGLDYLQKVTLQGDLLTFTGQDTVSGRPVVRIKVWQRIPARPSPPAGGGASS